MKTIFPLLFILSGLVMESRSQSMLTRRQVYDFNVNDEFHHTWPNAPPNARRIKITGKRFSPSNDTVFYKRYCDNYGSVVQGGHLVYFFDAFIDSVYYTDLDTLIDAQFRNFPIIDSVDFFHDTLYYSSDACGALVYEYEGCTGCGFEGSWRFGQFGQGLGEIIFRVYNPRMPWDDQDYMIYYKKGVLECGTPDTLDSVTVAAVNFSGSLSKTISLFPNPASTVLYFNNSSGESMEISFYNSSGILIRKYYNVLNDQAVDIRFLSKGLYYAIIKSEGNLYQRKVIIE